jgi:Protein of unknown function (DUF3037)
MEAGMKLKKDRAKRLPRNHQILKFKMPQKPFERRSYSVYLIQYVPNLAGEASITIGLLLFDPRHRSLSCTILDNFEPVRSLHPDADLELLDELQTFFDQQIRIHRADPERLLRAMKRYSNLIQISEPLACWLHDPKSELQLMLTKYTETILTIAQRQTA